MVDFKKLIEQRRARLNLTDRQAEMVDDDSGPGENIISVNAPTTVPAKTETDHSPAIKRQDAALARLKTQSESLLADAKLFVELGIENTADLETAAEYRISARNAIDGFEALLRPGIKELHEAHGRALARLNTLISPLTEADTLIAKAQGAYETKQRRLRAAEADRIAAAAEFRRQQELAEQLEEAAIEGDDAEIGELEEQIAAPPPPSMSIPVVHRATKIHGGSSKIVYGFNWVDIRKIDVQWLFDQIEHEIATKGDCIWLRRNVQSCVKLLGPRAGKMVGEGAIEIEDEVKVGIRRPKGE